MNIALFAADTVGYEVAKIFAEENESLTCLILDSKDRKGLNAEIIAVSGIKDSKRIIYSQKLYQHNILYKLRKLKLDLSILAWWPYIMKERLINIPKKGCLNFHPSYLPHNRGKDPNFWAIIENVPFGVSIHFVDAEIDSGDIAFQSYIETSWEDSGKTLYEKATREIIKLFKNNFSRIKSGDIPRKPQELKQGSFHKRKELESASKLDLNEIYTGRDLLNILRARTFQPYPAAWFVDKGKKYEVRLQIKKVNDIK
jgi:methionyl-tRNA formyltransferase